ncbi:MAG TPA: hypothetical protein VMG59_11100 [Phycisphaerae bacterium]|nr:hypothetical protein [Phycisphaerae bacterium]
MHARLLRYFLPALFLLLLGAGGPAQVPLAAPFGTVTLVGTISSASPITSIEAVQRDRANVLDVSNGVKTPWVFSGQIDSTTGRFTIPNLPAGFNYDLILWTQNARWEGVDMHYYRPVLAGDPATPDDLNQIVTFIEKTPAFTDFNVPLWIAADHDHASVIVEMIRTTSYHSGAAGSVIFRVELWYFQRFYSGWRVDEDISKVISRWRGAAAAIPDPWQYLPDLGGIDVSSDGKFKPIDITLPPPSADHGLDGPIPAAPKSQN